MGILSPVVQALVWSMFDGRHHVALCRTVGSQLVSDGSVHYLDHGRGSPVGHLGRYKEAFSASSLSSPLSVTASSHPAYSAPHSKNRVHRIQAIAEWKAAAGAMA